tara:strand:+ start:52 stop:390 length:339 start_codon:yes stop_codon:yes gene_type:complete
MNIDPLKRQVTDPNIEHAFTALNLLRRLDSEMPAQLVSFLFYIASHNGYHRQALDEDLGLSVAAGSRNITWRADAHIMRGREGLGLIIKGKDTVNDSRLLHRLIPKGLNFYE